MMVMKMAVVSIGLLLLLLGSTSEEPVLQPQVTSECRETDVILTCNPKQAPKPPVEDDAEEHPPLPQPRRKVQKTAPKAPRGGCWARVVTVSPGPLIRVEGQPVSIRCDVKDYGGPREQDFEWMMSRDTSGPRIKIISTFDAAYSHPSFSKRVASGDISVVRLDDNEVELKIAEVKALDAGLYWCQTPSTDSVISGNYEARVQLIVIPNTLKVSPQTPPPVILEGSDLTLSCNVTRELTQPTYLSVTWSVKRGATSEEILVFGPQGDVTVGPKFARRFADGGIRLVPGRNGLFELVISRVTSSDEGIYECNGTEWTHESGGRWIKIVESFKEMGTVAVTPTDGRDIITMERSGVVISNTSLGGGQGKRGDANLEKAGSGEYRLLVRGVSGEDGGSYACRVRAFIEKGKSAGGGGRWHMATEKTSSPLLVKVEQTRTGSESQTIGSLDGQGNLLPGSLYSDRLKSGVISLTRTQPNTFKLQFLHTQEVDMGLYTCSVSVWSVNNQGNLVKVSEQQSSPLTVRWAPKRPSLKVMAKHIREASVGGATFEMSCVVSPENLGDVGYSVLIQSQESPGSNVRTIMTLSPDSVLQHGGATDPNRRDNLVLTKSSAAEFRFRLSGVQLSDRGYYWCDITAWTKQQPGQAWTKVTSAESNKIRIDFQENVFSVNRVRARISHPPHLFDDMSFYEISCLLDDLAYEVRWFFTRLRGGETTTQVASIDRFGVVKKEVRNSSSDMSVERKDANAYVLSVHGTQDSDSGRVPLRHHPLVPVGINGRLDGRGGAVLVADLPHSPLRR
ncbi:unnamed protein product [Tetraodon nigroviridis]|uniref:(spotted green pufferfish) hypothetical protein n=1 Tax=Tetraodon nigroviridis TaxID=99883 RepID=Q4RY64_TETNG|nr:unnamed protein product [Tetraodon nigroviridis]